MCSSIDARWGGHQVLDDIHRRDWGVLTTPAQPRVSDGPSQAINGSGSASGPVPRRQFPGSAAPTPGAPGPVWSDDELGAVAVSCGVGEPVFRERECRQVRVRPRVAPPGARIGVGASSSSDRASSSSPERLATTPRPLIYAVTNPYKIPAAWAPSALVSCGRAAGRSDSEPRCASIRSNGGVVVGPQQAASPAAP
jgi:hypothetical protein